tara:strand:- start:1004 stop:1297 length:294 start_codon:yes stop_codon:yes gene_type:complete
VVYEVTIFVGKVELPGPEYRLPKETREAKTAVSRRLPYYHLGMFYPSTSLKGVSYLAGTDNADLAITMTSIAEPIRVIASMFDVRTNIKQNPVIPHA